MRTAEWRRNTRQQAVTAESLLSTFEQTCEQLGATWASLDPDADKVVVLGSVRDAFSDTVRSALGLRTQGRRGLEAVSPVLELIAGTLGEVFQGKPPSRQRTPPFQGVHLLSMHSGKIPSKSLQDLLLGVPHSQGCVMLLFEFTVFHSDSKLPNVARFDDIELPLQLHDSYGDTFAIAGCVDSNNAHFRAHVVLDEVVGLRVSGRAVDDGIYLVDPLEGGIPRAVRKASLPTSAADQKNALPKFRGPSYAPHIVVYALVPAVSAASAAPSFPTP